MISGPQYSHPMNRIHPIDPDRHEGDQRDGKKKRVLYQGRAWAETEEELPVQPSIPQNSQTPAKIRKGPAGVYADKAILEQAQNLFHKLTTIEEKAAQL